MTSFIVLTAKRHFFARKHVVWTIERKNLSREIRTGHDRTVRKVTLTWWETSTQPICTEICTVVAVPDVITCAVLKQIQGLRFYRGLNFRFSYWFLHGPYNSAAVRAIDSALTSTVSDAVLQKRRAGASQSDWFTAVRVTNHQAQQTMTRVLTQILACRLCWQNIQVRCYIFCS